VTFIASFSSYGEDILNVGDHGMIKFSTVISNIGGGYDNATGLFTAPMPGLYSFYFTSQSDNQHTSVFVVI
jgi:hypothetical protein